MYSSLNFCIYFEVFDHKLLLKEAAERENKNILGKPLICEMLEGKIWI